LKDHLNHQTARIALAFDTNRRMEAQSSPTNEHCTSWRTFNAPNRKTMSHKEEKINITEKAGKDCHLGRTTILPLRVDQMDDCGSGI